MKKPILNWIESDWFNEQYVPYFLHFGCIAFIASSANDAERLLQEFHSPGRAPCLVAGMTNRTFRKILRICAPTDVAIRKAEISRASVSRWGCTMHFRTAAFPSKKLDQTMLRCRKRPQFNCLSVTMQINNSFNVSLTPMLHFSAQ